MILNIHILDKFLIDDFDHNDTATVNQFIGDVLENYAIQYHTVSPMRWTFESQNNGLFDDGFIELRQTNDELKFHHIDVKGIKLTQSN